MHDMTRGRITRHARRSPAICGATGPAGSRPLCPSSTKLAARYDRTAPRKPAPRKHAVPIAQQVEASPGGMSSGERRCGVLCAACVAAQQAAWQAAEVGATRNAANGCVRGNGGRGRTGEGVGETRAPMRAGDTRVGETERLRPPGISSSADGRRCSTLPRTTDSGSVCAVSALWCLLNAACRAACEVATLAEAMQIGNVSRSALATIPHPPAAAQTCWTCSENRAPIRAADGFGSLLPSASQWHCRSPPRARSCQCRPPPPCEASAHAMNRMCRQRKGVGKAEA